MPLDRPLRQNVENTNTPENILHLERHHIGTIVTADS